jgi:hypothetical protein
MYSTVFKSFLSFRSFFTLKNKPFQLTQTFWQIQRWLKLCGGAAPPVSDWSPEKSYMTSSRMAM